MKLNSSNDSAVCKRQIIADVSFTTADVDGASKNKTKIVSIETEQQQQQQLLLFVLFFFFFLTGGGRASCFCACLDAMLLLQSYEYPNLSEGADSVGGQLRGNKECPFNLSLIHISEPTRQS